MIASLLAVTGLVSCAINTDTCDCHGGCTVVAPEQDLRASGTLNQSERDALLAALQDERRAQGFYQAVMDKHGSVRPFVNIIRAERNHEQAVATIMTRHRVPVPETSVLDIPELPPTFADCAALAARLEQENIDLYNQLLATCTRDDLRELFVRLRDASKDHHLPAFQRWSQS